MPQFKLMERQNEGGRVRKDKYVRLIEAKRDVLSDDDMELLLTLHEQPTKERAADELGISTEEINERLSILFPPKIDERRTKTGEKYARRLTNAAINAILIEHDGLEEDERNVLEALRVSRNQVIAASSLGMSYPKFMSVYKAIRRKHDF